MSVHTVKVSYSRSKQPVQYEFANPAVEFIASVEDGADHLILAASLMYDACQVAYSALAMEVPTGVAEKLGALELSDVGDFGPAERLVTTATVGEFVRVNGDTSATVVPITTKPAGKRGRPSNAEKAAAKAKDAPAPQVVQAPASTTTTVAQTSATSPPISDFPRTDVPDDTKAGTVVSPAAKAAASDVPDTAAVTAASPATAPAATSKKTHTDLQADITRMVTKDKSISVTAVKGVLAKFNAARVSEIPENKIEDCLKALEDEVQLAKMSN